MKNKTMVCNTCGEKYSLDDGRAGGERIYRSHICPPKKNNKPTLKFSLGDAIREKVLKNKK